MSKLDELLNKMKVEEYGVTSKSETKAQIKDLILEVIDPSDFESFDKYMALIERISKL